MIVDDASALIFGASSFFDFDDLATAILTAVRADVMRLAGFAAIAAAGEGDHGDAVMAAAVTLMRAADSLLRKCTHVEFLSVSMSLVCTATISRNGQVQVTWNLRVRRHRRGVLPIRRTGYPSPIRDRFE